MLCIIRDSNHENEVAPTKMSLFIQAAYPLRGYEACQSLAVATCYGESWNVGRCLLIYICCLPALSPCLYAQHENYGRLVTPKG